MKRWQASHPTTRSSSCRRLESCATRRRRKRNEEMNKRGVTETPVANQADGSILRQIRSSEVVSGRLSPMKFPIAAVACARSSPAVNCFSAASAAISIRSCSEKRASFETARSSGVHPIEHLPESRGQFRESFHAPAYWPACWRCAFNKPANRPGSNSTSRTKSENDFGLNRSATSRSSCWCPYQVTPAR
jgi:hypothetical protein